jgi:RNA polymerase sigma-70 factor, ECF subfamily
MDVARGDESGIPTAPPAAGAIRRERFERLFGTHFRSVLAYALRRAPRAEAEDVVAETFLIAWRRLDEVPSDERPWLLGVARRVLSNQRRAAGRRTALHERLMLERAGDASAEQPVPIVEALDQLPERDREVLILIAWDGLSTEDAAQVLGCSRVAARVRLHRARQRLRHELRSLQLADAQRPNRTSALEDTP